jgi:FkbM family methyltransferase
MSGTIRFKQAALSLASRAIQVGVGLLPDRARAIVLDRAPMVRPLDYERCRVLLHVHSELEYRVRLRSVSKEPQTVRWIESFRDGDVFYDIGANVGAYSLIAAKLFKGGVRVCAFEPSALNFGQLVRNVALNGCGESILPLPIALGPVTAVETFNYKDVSTGGALNSVGEPIDEEGRRFVPALRQRLLVHTLDDVMRLYDLPLPSHIKIDVDGGELGILSGAAGVLASAALRTLLIEARLDQAERFTALLHGAGLRLAMKHPVAPGYANLLFSREPGAEVAEAASA